MLSDWILPAAGAALVWLLGLAVYRVFLHPLAKFPGPKLAALSTWYEGYYDIVHQGRYLWQIEKMHERYGPIVRIGPNELHILDPNYYNTLYNQTLRLDKFAYFYGMLGIEDATFPTIRADVHKYRRAALVPYFSLKNAQRFAEPVKELADELTDRMKRCLAVSSSASAPTAEEKEAAGGGGGGGAVIPLFYAYRCVTVDLITEYIFGKKLGLMQREDWGKTFYASWRALWDMSPLIRQLPWMMPLLMGLPRWLTALTAPQALEVMDMQAQIDEMTREALLQDEGDEGEKGRVAREKGEGSILQGLANSEILPQQDKTFRRLRIEANNLLAAGFETTGATLSHITYNILANPEVKERLVRELKEAIPDESSIPSWQVLEKLPYLTAVLKEALRHSVGAYSRLPRVTQSPLTYTTHTIPPGTAVGMSALFVARNAAIFPDPDAFLPDRWLEPGAAARLDKYFLAFGKGARGCLGIHLAWAELYGVVAAVFRRFGEGMELWETGEGDVEAYHDYFAGMVRWGEGRDGLKVRIRG